ncbi:MAG: guanylate kinase, partial [Myxococcota bacterium]
EAMIAQEAFVEWAQVHGRFYGTSRDEVDRARREDDTDGIIFDVDFQGARQIRAVYPDAVSVFILPPSLAELERRLRGRGTEDEEATQRRLANAKREIAHYGLFDFVIVNDEVNKAHERMRSIVFSERCRRRHVAPRCEDLLHQAGVARLSGT